MKDSERKTFDFKQKKVSDKKSMVNNLKAWFRENMETSIFSMPCVD
jgi:hypothetical protein